MKKRLMVLLLVPVLALSTLAVSCKNNTVNQDMILFSVFNGGFGTDWATHAAEEFNKTEEKYKVQIVPNDDEWYAIEAGFESGTAEYDIYLNSIDFIEANSRGWLEDLTDVYNSRPDGEDSDTVYEKVKDRDKDYVDTVHKYEGKYYTIPFQDGFMGFIYDHDIFLQNGFLIGRNGTPITSSDQSLSLGRDGKEGTFDDGHPSNIAEYELMINKIQQTGMAVYLWTGLLSYYVTPLYSAIYAEYDGVDNYEKSFSLTGDYTNPETGEQLSFTTETGYLTFKMQGRYEALNFMDKYMADSLYYHTDSAKNTTNSDVHRAYIYGNAYGGSYQPAAFLFEGTWWENEARANFNSLANRGKTDYAYGVRDYRYMMLPLMDEHQEENGYVLPVFDSMSLFVKKQTDTEKSNAIKRFLTYLHTDEEMRYYTSTTGGVKPFDYTLTVDDYNSMSKFAKTSYEIYNSDSVNVIRTSTDQYRYRDYYTMGINIAMTRIGNVTYQHPIQLMLRGSGITTIANARQIYEGAINYYTETWESTYLSRLS